MYKKGKIVILLITVSILLSSCYTTRMRIIQKINGEPSYNPCDGVK